MFESVSFFQTLSASIGMVGFAYRIRGSVSLTKRLSWVLILLSLQWMYAARYLISLEHFWALHRTLKLATFFNWSLGCWFRWCKIFDNFEGPLGGDFENRESVIVAIVGCRAFRIGISVYFPLFGVQILLNINIFLAGTLNCCWSQWRKAS